MLVLGLGVLILSLIGLLGRPADPQPRRQSLTPCRDAGDRHYTALVFGDEPAGVMTALALQHELRRLRPDQPATVALVTDADTRLGLGGVIARGGLAYLDRNQIPLDFRSRLPAFAPSSALYQEFLDLTGTGRIAVDPQRASQRFRQRLQQAGIPVLDRAQLRSVQTEGPRICTLRSGRWGELGADLFIDASLGADLAHRAGVPFTSGFAQVGLPTSSLALGWVFEVTGLSLADFRRVEDRLSRRLLDPRDHQAQGWLAQWPQYRSHHQRLVDDLQDWNGQVAETLQWTPDSADQQSPALAIAFHGQTHLPADLRRSPVRLDLANIALLPGRLSFNALLLRNDAAQNRRILAGGSRPLPWMRPYAAAVTRFFKGLGAHEVHWMPELYVRSADQLRDPLEPLTAQQMAWGGVPGDEALGTFSYNLDFRGGLPGISHQPRPTFNFGYRHTLPRNRSNLAVLGPAAGYGGLGAGAGRIIELNISSGAGVAIASALALRDGVALADVDPAMVPRLLSHPTLVYGRPTLESLWGLLLNGAGRWWQQTGRG